MIATMPTARYLCLLILFAATALFLELGRMDVITDNEGQRAAPPAEMLRSGDFIVPTLNGQPYLAKPPLLYWAIAGVYQLTGVITPLTARIPTALCGFALILAVYVLGRRHLGEGPARWGALIMLGAPYFLERARWAELDVPLTLATLLAVAALYGAFTAAGPGRQVALTLLAGLCLGAGVLLKGPVPLLFAVSAWLAHAVGTRPGAEQVLRSGIRLAAAALVAALPLLFLPISFPLALAAFAAGAVYLAVRGHRAWVRTLGLTSAACAVGLALAAPWGLAVVRQVGWTYIDTLLHEQVVERTYWASRINSGSPLFYLVALPVLLAPWGVFIYAGPLAAALRGGPSRWRALADACRPSALARAALANRAPFERFAVLHAAISIVLFSLIAGKEYEYIMPAFPFLALALGGWVHRWISAAGDPCRRANRQIAWAATGLAVLACMYFSIAEPSWALRIELTILTGVIALVAWRSPFRRAGLATRGALCPILFVLMLLLGARSFHYSAESDRSPRHLAVLCRALLDAGYTVEASKVYPAFSFFAERPIREETDPGAVAARLAADQPYYYLTRTELFEAMAHSAESKVKVLTGEYTAKDLIVIGNAPLPPLAGAQALAKP